MECLAIYACLFRSRIPYICNFVSNNFEYLDHKLTFSLEFCLKRILITYLLLARASSKILVHRCNLGTKWNLSEMK